MDSSSSYNSSSDSDNYYGREINRPRRSFRPRINLTYNFNDFVFKEKFRVSKTSVEYLENSLGQNLQTQSQRNHSLTPLEQLLCALEHNII